MYFRRGQALLPTCKCICAAQPGRAELDIQKQARRQRLVDYVCFRARAASWQGNRSRITPTTRFKTRISTSASASFKTLVSASDQAGRLWPHRRMRLCVRIGAAGGSGQRALDHFTAEVKRWRCPASPETIFSKAITECWYPNQTGKTHAAKWRHAMRKYWRRTGEESTRPRFELFDRNCRRAIPITLSHILGRAISGILPQSFGPCRPASLHQRAAKLQSSASMIRRQIHRASAGMPVRRE